MMGDNILTVCLGAVLCWTSVSAEKTHTLSINKVEPLKVDAEWVKSDWNMKLTRMDRNIKLFNWKGTFKRNITGSILCKATVLQKVNGNFVPTPMETAEKPCCETVEGYNVVWPCLKKFSNFPEKCPILAGEYSVEKLNLNECDLPVFLPPMSPEEYKVIFTAKNENMAIFTLTAYATAKMKMLG